LQLLLTFLVVIPKGSAFCSCSGRAAPSNPPNRRTEIVISTEAIHSLYVNRGVEKSASPSLISSRVLSPDLENKRLFEDRSIMSPKRFSNPPQDEALIIAGDR
jgi:hypothetical protein